MKVYSAFLWVVLIGLQLTVNGQEIVRKHVTALRIAEAIRIDGVLDEVAYKHAEVATDFVQIQPYNGKPSYQPTEVKILYDDNAIYIGAMLFDNPDSIRSYITTRDNIGVSDYFDVFIDPNNEGLTAYEFLVTPANSQADLKAVKQGGGDNEDASWDAVWQSATKIVENGWVAEFRIPYSALRFPANKENPVWGINFFRRIRRHNSNNSWNLINAEISGFIQQTGELHGLKDIKAPVRLSISPYVAGYVESTSDNSNPNFLFKGGLDLKYGLSESHTLDMMLIPDFGQIQSDDKQLNLSPYELYYSEKRQFFIEGAELFNRLGIFYSRRIGTTPKFSDRASESLKANETVTYNPSETQLLNATKISGRDKNGLGIGFLNAMTLESRAEITDTITGDKRNVVTQPFTNYNVSVIEKALQNNSYISLINTNVSMIGDPYKANVLGTEFQLKNKTQTHQLSGGGGFSYRSTAESKTGYGGSLSFRKIKGKFRYYGETSLANHTLNINDLGYLRRNNEISSQAGISYYIHEPFWILKNWSTQSWIENSMLYHPNELISNEINFWTDATFKNNMWSGIFFAYNFGTDDFYEPRVENRYYSGPQHYIAEVNFNTNSDLKFSWSSNEGTYVARNNGTYGYWISNNFWWKATQRFSMFYEVTSNQERESYGYVNHYNNDSIVFGQFNRHTLTNTVSLAYNFNTKMKVDFRARHYWSRANYTQYYLLNMNGSLSDFHYNQNADVNFNAFNIDMNYKWEFAPGSELSITWKNAIYASNNLMNQRYSDNLRDMFSAVRTNSISLRILYYIDYNYLRNVGKKEK